MTEAETAAPKRGFLYRLRRSFDIYDVDPEDRVNAYYSSQDPQQLVSMFEPLREELEHDNRFPLLLKRQNDYAFYVLEKPEPKPERIWSRVVLLLATIASCVIAGALFTYSYDSTLGVAQAADSLTLPYLVRGLIQFAIPLLLVLGFNEAAQYLVAHHHGLRVHFPLFIPLPPPLSFLGTLGALSGTKDPVPDRRTMVEVGAAGPLAAFVTSTIFLALGLSVSTQLPAAAGADAGSSLDVGRSLMYVLLSRMLSLPADAILHPIAVAGWIGMFLTSLQLLPVGAFDGGSVARAALGRQARWLGAAVVVAMVALGFSWWPWWVLALLVLVGGVAKNQPLNDITPLRLEDWLVAFAALVALLLTIPPVPLTVRG